MLIKNARVLDPETSFDKTADIRIEGGRVEAIGELIPLPGEETLNASGLVAAPGLVDTHVHFRDPGFTYKEDMHSGAQAAVAGGFTSVVCMANTKPAVDNAETLRYILDTAKGLPINLYQAAAVTKGLEGGELCDMRALADAGAAGFTDDGMPIMNSALAVSAMLKAKELGLPISLHEEDKCLIAQNGINPGAAKKLGLLGSPPEAEESMVARDCLLALKSGAKVVIQHISSALSVELVRHAKGLGANVFAEATPHHFTLSEEDVAQHGTLAKMNPPLRTEEDRLAIIGGLCDGAIDIIATDHAPHSVEEKEKPFANAPSGIIGLETSLSLGITELVNKGYLTLIELINKMSLAPSRLYGLPAGRLYAGGTADIVIFDPTERYRVERFFGKSVNSPFLGREICGRVKYTIRAGNIVFKQ